MWSKKYNTTEFKKRLNVYFENVYLENRRMSRDLYRICLSREFF